MSKNDLTAVRALKLKTSVIATKRKNCRLAKLNKQLVRGCCTISWDQQRKAGRKAREVKDDPLRHFPATNCDTSCIDFGSVPAIPALNRLYFAAPLGSD
jgi:hypothetical protein